MRMKKRTDVLKQQMSHLGRKGVPLLVICQKFIIGHPKAPTPAWMLNGYMQVMVTGLVPGNFNSDNIEPVLEKFEHLLFSTEWIQTREVKADILSFLGFGQKGDQMIGVALKYLFATLHEVCPRAVPKDAQEATVSETSIC